MRRKLSGLLLAAFLLLVMLPGVGVARPQDTFTVVCPGFTIGQGKTFTQTLPEQARHGSLTSISQTNPRSDDNCVQIG